MALVSSAAVEASVRLFWHVCAILLGCAVRLMRMDRTILPPVLCEDPCVALIPVP